MTAFAHAQCPECGSKKIVLHVAVWQATSLEEPTNTGELIEHQCADCSRAFWIGNDKPKALDLDWLALTNEHAARFIAWGRKIGIGFHPDNAGDDYTPALSLEEIRAYNDAMNNAHSFLSDPDPYAIGAALLERLAQEQQA